MGRAGGNARGDVQRPARPATRTRRARRALRALTSCAVAAEHLLLVRELAPVLHQVAVLAHELGRWRARSLFEGLVSRSSRTRPTTTSSSSSASGSSARASCFTRMSWMDSTSPLGGRVPRGGAAEPGGRPRPAPPPEARDRRGAGRGPLRPRRALRRRSGGFLHVRLLWTYGARPESKARGLYCRISCGCNRYAGGQRRPGASGIPGREGEPEER